MVIQCAGDTAAVVARLEALSREWRESRLPAELREHGIYQYTLKQRGPTQFFLSVRLPGRHHFTCATDIEIVQDSFGTTLRYNPRLDPRLKAACPVYAVMFALPVLALSWKASFDLFAVIVAAVSGAGFACVAYWLASIAMRPVAPGIGSLLRRAAEETSIPATA
jgi:hypothetical protein